jgi:hypothetical protein
MKNHKKTEKIYYIKIKCIINIIFLNLKLNNFCLIIKKELKIRKNTIDKYKTINLV